MGIYTDINGKIFSSLTYEEISSMLLSEYDFIHEFDENDNNILKECLFKDGVMVYDENSDGASSSFVGISPFAAAREIITKYCELEDPFGEDFKDFSNPAFYKPFMDIYIDLLSMSNADYDAYSLNKMKEEFLSKFENLEREGQAYKLFYELKYIKIKSDNPSDSYSENRPLIYIIDSEVQPDLDEFLSGNIDDASDRDRFHSIGTQNNLVQKVLNLKLPPDNEIVFLRILPEWDPWGTVYTIPLTDLNSVSVSASANFKSENILGRSSAFYSYSNSSGRSFTFNLKIHEEICLYYTGLTVMQLGDYILSLEYPEYDSFIVRPPIVAFSIGKLYPGLRGVIAQAEVNYSGPYRNGLPTVLETSFSIQEITDVALSANVIAGFNIQRSLWGG